MSDYLITIILYILVYTISLTLFSYADHGKTRQVIIRRLAVGVLVLSVFAGVRAPSVGTDTVGTITYYFENAKNYQSITSIISEFNSLRGSFVYLIIAKTIIAAGFGFRTYLTVIEGLIVTPIVISAYLRRDKTPIAITMAFYVLLYYQLGFNWIRQSICVSFLILAVSCFLVGKKKTSIGLMLFSTLLHSSALFGIIFLIIIKYASGIQKRLLRNTVLIITVALTIVIMQNWQRLSLMAIQMGILPYSYNGYINVFSGAHGTSFKGWFVIGIRTYVEYILRILMFILPMIVSTKNTFNREMKTQFSFFQMGALLSILIYSAAFFGLHTAYGNRVTYVLDGFNIIYFGFANFRARSSKLSVVPVSGLIIVILCIVYNIWLYYILGWHDTVPYYFSF